MVRSREGGGRRKSDGERLTDLLEITTRSRRLQLYRHVSLKLYRQLRHSDCSLTVSIKIIVCPHLTWKIFTDAKVRVVKIQSLIVLVTYNFFEST